MIYVLQLNAIPMIIENIYVYYYYATIIIENIYVHNYYATINTILIIVFNRIVMCIIIM